MSERKMAPRFKRGLAPETTLSKSLLRETAEREREREGDVLSVAVDQVIRTLDRA